MTRPWSPAELEERAFNLRRHLADVVTRLLELATVQAAAVIDYKLSKAQSLLEARARHPKDTVDERRARVDNQVADLEFQATIAEEAYRTARERIRVGLAELDLLRTMIVSHRNLIED